MKDLKKEIDNNSLSGIYLFTGDEKYLIKFYEKKIISSLVGSNFADMNLTVLDGKLATADKIIEAAETLPFMTEKKLVIIKNSSLFSMGRKEESEEITNYIEKDFDLEHSSTVLLFIEDEVDKRGKLYKAINKKGRFVCFEQLSENELMIWLAKMLKKHIITISSADAKYLFKNSSGNMEIIESEAQKLIAYKKEGKIYREDIDALCVKTLEAKIFDLIDAIGSKNSSTALEIYKELLLSKETPIGILALVSRQFRLMLKTKLLHSKGNNEAKIAAELHEKPYSVKQSLAASRNFSLDTIKQAALDCINCDTDIKSGLQEGVLGVELLIIKYTSVTSQ